MLKICLHFRAAFLTLLKICNVLLTIVGHIMNKMADSRNFFNDRLQSHDENLPFTSAYSLIREAFYSLPHQSTDAGMRNVLASRVTEKFIEEV